MARAAPVGIANRAAIRVADKLTRKDRVMMVIKSVLPERIRPMAVVKISMSFPSPCGASPLALLCVIDKLRL
jgi:hypothetical protein